MLPYYVGRDRMLKAVDVGTQGFVTASRPIEVMEWRAVVSTPARQYDVFPDGSFVIAVADDDRSRLEQFGVTEFHVILNFFEELKERVGN